jgi:hypothetical protein
VESCGGGFFHTPTGLRLATAPGEIRFFEYADGDSPPIGVAIATVRRCRFSLRPRHASFATWPAFKQHADWEDAIGALRETLLELQIAEAVFESFDSDGESPSGSGLGSPMRSEYRVRLNAGADDLASRCCATHRRKIRQGQEARWNLRVLRGDIARHAIATVQDLAAARAAERGDGFDVATPVAEAWSATSFEDPWGAATLGAYRGDELLGAAVIGWANRRAFYVTGGSTEPGYAEGASTWMHWKAMNIFRDAGGTWYNLGGVAGTRVADDDPSAGLHRFKAGFGAERSVRSGARWEIAPAHLKSHSAARWIAGKASA